MSRTSPVRGGKEIAATLTALGKRIETQAVRSGLTAAGGVIRDEARVRAPKRTGKMAKSIKTGSPRRNQDGTFSVSVRLVGDHAFLGLFHEYGVRPHFISGGDSGKSANLLTRAGASGIDVVARKAGKDQPEVLSIDGKYISGAVHHPGHAAHPFMRPALDAKADEAVAAFRDKIVAVVEGKTGYNIDAAADEAA
jgi:HK97 gp10 family phage protein